ncbi:MAG: WhiB family transcriptional regulator [Acidimicrobiia bacterium]
MRMSRGYIENQPGIIRVEDRRSPMDPVFDVAGNWRHEAACIGMDPNIFFPAEGVPDRRARATCAGCVVRDECLAYALTMRMDAGVWGGTSGTQRRFLRREMRRAV